MLAEVAPPWTLKFLTAGWDMLQSGIGPELMPQEMPGSTAKHRKVDALGCGHYGCVTKTNTPGFVLKVTSDPSEAAFVKAAVAIGEWPTGIVRYRAVFDLPGMFRGRPVFAIWREEAFDIGQVHEHNADPHSKREFEQYHSAYRHAATYVREVSVKPGFAAKLAEAKAHEDWAWGNVIWEDGGSPSSSSWGAPRRPPKFKSYPANLRLAAALRICAICFELMENTNYAHEVGSALGFYLDQGILLADVHMMNIGQVTRDDGAGYGPQTYTVITDPGHAVFLR